VTVREAKERWDVGASPSDGFPLRSHPSGSTVLARLHETLPLLGILTGHCDLDGVAPADSSEPCRPVLQRPRLVASMMTRRSRPTLTRSCDGVCPGDRAPFATLLMLSSFWAFMLSAKLSR